jgi:hypothetical protein
VLALNAVKTKFAVDIAGVTIETMCYASDLPIGLRLYPFVDVRFLLVHYLILLPDTQPGLGSLDVVLYDSFSGKIICYAGEGDILCLVDVIVAP